MPPCNDATPGTGRDGTAQHATGRHCAARHKTRQDRTGLGTARSDPVQHPPLGAEDAIEGWVHREEMAAAGQHASELRSLPPSQRRVGYGVFCLCSASVLPLFCLCSASVLPLFCFCSASFALVPCFFVQWLGHWVPCYAGLNFPGRQ